MQFSTTWTRYKGAAPAGGRILGTDDPVPGPGYLSFRDNYFNARRRVDRPAGRIAVAYNYAAGVGPAPNLTVDGYIYESTTNAWYRVTAAPVALVPGLLTYLPLIGGLVPSTAQNQNINMYIRVIAAGGEVDGTYVFAADADERVVP